MTSNRVKKQPEYNAFRLVGTAHNCLVGKGRMRNRNFSNIIGKRKRGIQVNEYSHCNGDRETPTIPGYFFLNGWKPAYKANYGLQLKEIVRIDEWGFLHCFHPGDQLVNTRAMDWQGRWWGPIPFPEGFDHFAFWRSSGLLDAEMKYRLDNGPEPDYRRENE